MEWSQTHETTNPRHHASDGSGRVLCRRSPIYGGTTEPPVVVPPPNAPVEAPVVIEPGWELYPWVYGAPYGYWAGGYFGGLPYRFAPQSYQFNCFCDSAHSVS